MMKATAIALLAGLALPVPSTAAARAAPEQPAAVAGSRASMPVARPDDPGRSGFAVILPAHSFRAFSY